MSVILQISAGALFLTLFVLIFALILTRNFRLEKSFFTKEDKRVEKKRLMVKIRQEEIKTENRRNLKPKKEEDPLFDG